MLSHKKANFAEDTKFSIETPIEKPSYNNVNIL